MLRTLRLIAAIALASAGLSVYTSGPASAACNSGDICYWGEDAYTGCYWDTPNDDTALSNNYWFNCSSYSVNQGVNSAGNFGNSCTIMFFDFNNYTGGNHWMSRIGLGGYWYDANFGNNNWTNFPGVVENDISSHNFCP